MLIEVDSKTYSKYFLLNPHPFIAEQFVELNRAKAERVVRLVTDNNKPMIGLVAGIKESTILSPFSAPFGGFHFHNEVVYTNEIDFFLVSLKAYILSQGLSGVEITLPPDLYHMTFNTKVVNSLFRNKFTSTIPEITNWIDLKKFNEVFTQKNSREFYRQAVRNGLSFELAADEVGKNEIYDLICENRAKFGRPIYMSLKDINDTSNLWPVDFFKVCTRDQNIIASAIFYRNHSNICYAVFWGDNENGRPLRAMDYLVFNLFKYYKELGLEYIDLGISTEKGNPNEGLLRFKESHEAISSLRFSFSWHA
jgi:hypothetical protein